MQRYTSILSTSANRAGGGRPVIQKFVAGKAKFEIDSHRYGWCAVRCFLKTPDNIRLAHSTPFYLDGHSDSRADAAYFVDWIDDLIARMMHDPARFRNEAERREGAREVPLGARILSGERVSAAGAAGGSAKLPA
jgi:hypothetical protein